MDDWRACRLGDVVTLKRGYDLPHQDRRPGPFPVVSSAGVTDHHAEAKAHGPGVVTGRYGTLGEVFFVEGDFWPLNTALYVRDFKGNDPRFVSYFLRELNFGTQNAAGAVPGVNRNHLHAMDVRVPPLPVQRRIAGILSAYDDLIENCERRIRVLDEMARTLYREWFVLFRFPGHEELPLVASARGPIPPEWAWRRLDEFGEVITGKTPSKANANYYGNAVPFLKLPDMHGNRFILRTDDCLSEAGAASQSNKTIPAGSLCVSCIGTVGIVSIPTSDCQTNQQINSIVLGEEYCREFLLFRISDAKVALENLGSSGATMANVSKGKLASLEFLTPPGFLLRRYHQLAAPLFRSILALSQEISNLRTTRDLLLPRLLSGQLTVQDAE